VIKKTLSMPPIVTLTTDFGQADAYVAAMKAAVLREAPQARLIDISHQIPPQNVRYGSFILERAIDAFHKMPGRQIIHIAVVDPGVGTSRKLLIVKIQSQTVICPDNGLITWPWRNRKNAKAYELTWRPERSQSKSISRTFHGRDILAPAAGLLAAETPLRKLAPRSARPKLLDIFPMKKNARQGRIIHIDHFGNAITNITREAVGTRHVSIRVGGHAIGRIKQTYAEAEIGEPLALFGSADLLEIAVRDGSAAEKLGLKVGRSVNLSSR
jgi:S-adenosyl-L-methionine hydrolase (adenosine-forming)